MTGEPDTTSSPNPKARAWEAIGLKYWSLGRRTGKPRPSTLRWFSSGLGPDERCLVVGGTSVGMIRAAAATGCGVVVADFSRRVCSELRGRAPAGVTVVQRDVLEPVQDWEEGFTHLLCDALLNRFDAAEARRFERRAAVLLRTGGELRTTVKIGLYPMDLRMLELAPQHLQADFWDPRTQTMDYGRLGSLLEAGMVRHGGIARADLIGWYRNRGREKRFSEEDLHRLFAPPRWSPLDLRLEGRGSDRVLFAARRSAQPVEPPGT